MVNKEKTVTINYLFFGGLFFLLFSLTSYNLFHIEKYTGAKTFFLLFTLGQTTLEVAIFIFLGWIIQRKCSKRVFLMFNGLIFMLFTVHIVDFVVHRIMDLTFWNTLSLVMDEDIQNFLEMLYASNIPLWAWISAALVFALLPIVGMVLYKLTELLSNKKPLKLKQGVFIQTFFCIPLALFLWEFTASKIIKPEAYHAYLSALPWKTTFIEPEKMVLSHLHPPLKPPSENSVQALINQTNFSIKDKPNIFLFIIESLREDFITDEITPALNAFKEKSFHPELSFSSANGTHLSWFSIFNSRFPHLWTEHKNWQKGSISLKMLKKMGYLIHVYSSAALGYYGMEKILFGKKALLLNTFHPLTHRYPTEPYETDSKTIEYLAKDLNVFDSGEGNLFVIFWDSSHFDYNWPKDKPNKFSPVAVEKDYFKPSHNAYNIELLKNSYKNALNFLDSLFEKFLQTLKEKNIHDKSIIIVTGDHGEEFNEHGRVLHASHLSHEQTHVPMYFYFPEKKFKKAASLCSHIDIFPTIFHYLTNQTSYSELFQGESIFAAEKWPFVMSARYNMSRSPYEFFLHNGQEKVIFRFKNRKNIFRSRILEILKIKNLKEENVHQDNVENYVLEEFGEAIQKVFGS